MRFLAWGCRTSCRCCLNEILHQIICSRGIFSCSNPNDLCWVATSSKCLFRFVEEFWVWRKPKLQTYANNGDMVDLDESMAYLIHIFPSMSLTRGIFVSASLHSTSRLLLQWNELLLMLCLTESSSVCEAADMQILWTVQEHPLRKKMSKEIIPPHLWIYIRCLCAEWHLFSTW